MLWGTYDEYKTFMKSKNTTPLSEEIWKREYGPKDETHREPMIITPQNRQRPIRPTFDNHISSKSLAKASKHTDYLDNLENIQQSDFTNPEHYFDALEAKQILEQMRNAG